MNQDNLLYKFLSEAYQEQLEPLERDVVQASRVATWLVANTRVRPSPDSIGRILVSLGAIRRVVKLGATAHRVLILRGKRNWMSESAREILDYINGVSPPDTEAGRAILNHIRGIDATDVDLCS